MRNYPCQNCWSSYPTRHEALMWGAVGIGVGLMATVMILIQAI